eukprot:501996_1
MSSSTRLDYNKFVLLPKNGDHKVKIFDNLSPGELIDDTLNLPINNLTHALPGFTGRNIDMRHIIHQLMDTNVNLLVLRGIRGIGKSATALMVARYLCDRKMFGGGIYFVDVKALISTNKYNSFDDMLLKVFQDTERTFKTDNDKTKRNKHNVFNIIRNKCEKGYVLLVFDGLDEAIFNKRFNLIVYGYVRINMKQSISIPSDMKQMISMFFADNDHLIRTFLQNIFDKCNRQIKVLVTTCRQLHMFTDFTNCIMRYYMLGKLRKKEAAKLFSRYCNQFRYKDIMANNELMGILECNPKQILRIVTIKHLYGCNTLEEIVIKWKEKYVHLRNKKRIIVNL